MRVLMLSWEYPPLVVGGLARHVTALAGELAAEGHEVRVVTRGEAGTRQDEHHGRLRIVRAAADPLAIDFTTESLLAWAATAEHALVRAALPVTARWRPDVVHAHDWLVAQTGVTLAETTGAPLVATFHATEAGRHQGWLPRPLNVAIDSVERWLANRAAAVITCSTTMRDEVRRQFELPAERITVVPNGSYAELWTTTARERRARRRELGEDGPLLVYAGRLVHEKGVQTLLHGVRLLRATHPGLRLAIAGTGVHEPALRELARRLRIARSIEWLGFVPADELPTILGAADVVVVPSHYEPFGIVALEAAAAGAPVAVAAVGGLRDLAAAGVAAASFPPDDAPALAASVEALLADPEAARRSARRAARIAKRDYTWPAVVPRTAAVYERAAQLSQRRSVGR